MKLWEVLSKLHKELDIGVRVKHLVVVGDQKTYTRLWDPSTHMVQILTW